MPIRISKKVQKILAKKDAKAGVHDRPPPPPKAKAPDPESDLLFALQLFSVKGGVLMMVKQATGKSYRVKRYNPATRTATLERPGHPDDEFDTRIDHRTLGLYAPLWR